MNPWIAEGDAAGHDAVPEHYKDQAEAVRAHLVHLRGGAPFLSPSDALCLVRWLDASVSLRAILAALDRAVEARRRKRAKRPLTLGAARVHLHRPPLVPPPFLPSGASPFAPVQEALHALQEPEADALAVALGGLPPQDPDTWVPAARAVCREHLEGRWNALAPAEKERRIADATLTLGDLARLVDADTLRALAEEVARDAFHLAPRDTPWPRLDTATFDALVEGS